MAKEVPLSNGKFGTTIVDDDRYEEVAKYQWLMCLTGNGESAVAVIGSRLIYLAHFIAGTSQHTHRLEFVDKNGRNCQRMNIVVTYDKHLDATSRR